MNKNKAK